MLEGDCLQAAFGDLDRGNDPLAVHFANPPAAQNHPSIILRCGRYAAASSGARTNVPACYHPPPVTITTWSPSTKNAAPICVLALGLSHMVGTFFSENASQKAQETASGASASPVASTSTSASTSDPALANPTVLLEALEDPQRWFPVQVVPSLIIADKNEVSAVHKTRNEPAPERRIRAVAHQNGEFMAGNLRHTETKIDIPPVE
ncbi:hypothetical protein DL766_010435 [Monosporascus sp. MC13-8B]|nr:hypothetical protein DL763_005676 [Monosporascus cannonballus]RYP01789.1 hypothetical protein DL766_010435 [Monosporascus sp. MC13-8B]